MLSDDSFLLIVMIPRSGKHLHQSILDAAMRSILLFYPLLIQQWANTSIEHHCLFLRKPRLECW